MLQQHDLPEAAGWTHCVPSSQLSAAVPVLPGPALPAVALLDVACAAMRLFRKSAITDSRAAT